MVFLKNLEGKFKEKSFNEKLSEKIGNLKNKRWFKYIKPFKYLPVSSTVYYTAFDAKKDLKNHGGKRVILKETLHVAYGTFAKIMIGGYLVMGHASGIWNPLEFAKKKIEPIIEYSKIKKEEFKEKKEKSNLHTNYLTNSSMHTYPI